MLLNAQKLNKNKQIAIHFFYTLDYPRKNKDRCAAYSRMHTALSSLALCPVKGKLILRARYARRLILGVTLVDLKILPTALSNKIKTIHKISQKIIQTVRKESQSKVKCFQNYHYNCWFEKTFCSLQCYVVKSFSLEKGKGFRFKRNGSSIAFKTSKN